MYKNKFRFTINLTHCLVMVILLTFTGKALAQVPAPPDYISYAGQVTKPDGTPVDPGAYDLEVTIYDAATAGNLVWGPFILNGSLDPGHAAKAYVMNDGRFSVLLGPIDTANRPLRVGITGNGQSKRFVQIRIGDLATAEPILPRQELLSGMYAFQAYQTVGVGPLVNYDNGNFGLGVKAPTARLDVNGDLTVRGSFGSGSIEADSMAVTNATFTGNVTTEDTTVSGNTSVTGSVSGNLVISNAQQISYIASLYMEEGALTGDFPVPGATSNDWYCALSNYTITGGGMNGCVVSYNNGWGVHISRENDSAIVQCRVNCIKMQ